MDKRDSGIIKIEELEIGDEILIPKNSDFIFAKVIRKPQRSKATYRWRPSVDRWKSVKCIVKKREEKFTWGNSNQYSRTITRYVCDGDYNAEKSLNLNFKSIWLVRREEKC